MKAWWNNLSKRNRTMVLGCGSAIILALIFTNQFIDIIKLVLSTFK